MVYYVNLVGVKLAQANQDKQSREKKISVFKNGRSQAIRIPSEWRFPDGSEVYMRRDVRTGELILSDRPSSWDDFIAFAQTVDVPDSFLDKREGTSTMGKKAIF